MRLDLVLGMIAVMMFGACSPAGKVAEDKPDFRTALDVHLKSVTSRDLDGFSATLTGEEELYVIFPNGAALTSTKAVIDFHSEWFEDKEWVMEPEVVKVIEGKDMATALVRYTFRDNLGSEPRSSWLVLVFQLEDGEWRLVHDQNTRIEKESGQ